MSKNREVNHFDLWGCNRFRRKNVIVIKGGEKDLDIIIYLWGRGLFDLLKFICCIIPDPELPITVFHSITVHFKFDSYNYI